MNLYQKIEKTIDFLNQPNQYDYDLALHCLKVIHKWFDDPDNDCLRARGDHRWQKMCELQGKLVDIMKPF
jgi:hypothetical protein